ncbi:ead/Ea22-like family protein [Escherichia coli]|uniref:ead/Ea22-like family protein n=2 Tax=Escherichia coli TaxID=562 RepID=UPI001FF1A9AC|nr:ead/Ea22-like family protein [Escherichia coli]
MSKINYQALREAAEKAGEDKWQAKKINGDFFVIRHGSYTRQHGYTSYQPIAEIDCKPVRDFVAKANPATVLALLDERERNQQYIKRRDQENEDIALTVGKLRIELEETKSKLNEQREYYEGVISDGCKRIAELEAREVQLPTRYDLRYGHPINEGERQVMIPKENGSWLYLIDLEHALRVAGIRIKGE